MSKKALPVIIVLLIIASFLAGTFYTRSTFQKQAESKPESQGQAAGVQTEAPPDTDDPLSSKNLRKYAKTINLDLDKFEKCLSDNKYGQRLIDDANYAVSVGVNGSPSFFINGKYFVGAPENMYELFKEIIDKEIAGTASDMSSYSQYLQEYNKQKGFDLNPPKTPIIKENTPAKGPQSASVTIIEFTDPSCPFCTRAAKTLDQLFTKYPDKLKVAFYYFPGHGTGDEATKAMFCAQDQGKFWQYYDQIFDANAQKYDL